MRSLCGRPIAVSLCLLLAACGGKEPKGQVVATIDGKEVTATELQNELGSVRTPSAQARKQVEQQALNGILVRKALARAAEKAGVGKTPEFAQQENAMREALLVRTWQGQIAKLTPQPSRLEADTYIADNPDMYAKRKIWLVDQIIFPASNDPSLAAAIRPLNTLDEIANLLTSRGIPYRQGENQIDALATGPKTTAEVLKLPPGEVFVVASGSNFVANRIRETRVTPFTGDQAVRHATALLKAQRTNDAIQRQFSSVLAQSKKEIKYAKEYEPQSPPNATTPTT
jgi:EpsD family peptidyl-prolyl cis-trans isomerase